MPFLIAIMVPFVKTKNHAIFVMLRCVHLTQSVISKNAPTDTLSSPIFLTNFSTNRPSPCLPSIHPLIPHTYPISSKNLQS